MKAIVRILQCPLMLLGGLALYIAWKLEPERMPFYRWLELYGYYYPEKEDANDQTNASAERR